MTDISQVNPDPPPDWFDNRNYDEQAIDQLRHEETKFPCEGCAKLFDELAALRTMVTTIGEQNNWIVETLQMFQQGFAGIQAQMASMGPMAMVKAMVGGGKKNG